MLLCTDGRCDSYRKGAGPAYDVRMVRRARSKHLLPWTDGKPNPFDHGAGWNAPYLGEWQNTSVVMRADEQDLATHPRSPLPPGSEAKPVMDYYGMTPWFVDQGDGFGLYYMATMRYWHWGPGNADVLGGDIPDQPGTKDIALAVSRDGESFEFLDGRKPWLRPGRDGTVGSRTIWLASPGPVRVGDEELYFIARTNVAEGPTIALDPQAQHGWEGEMGVGRLRLNGLMSLDAPYLSDAVLTTKDFVFAGHRLLLNVNAAGGGSLVVEVHRADAPPGAPALLTSVPLTRNGVELEALWGATPTRAGNATAVGRLAGQPVRLVMRMRDCELYSFRYVQ